MTSRKLSVAILDYFDFIKIGHTLFALPFCLIAVLCVSRTVPADSGKILWILLAFVSARAFAMSVNRILDRGFDAENPRTAGRHLPTGAISPASAKIFAVACAFIFVFAAARLNFLCAILSPFVLAYLAFYSCTKRFTMWSHVALGGALAIAPLGAEAALRGAISWPTVSLAAGVLFWVAGFDIFYACLDVDFDRRAGLFSLPSRLGPDRASRVAALFHAASFFCFILFGYLSSLGKIFFAAQGVILTLLIYEYILVRRSRILPAVFQLNALLSMVQLAAVILDLRLAST